MESRVESRSKIDKYTVMNKSIWKLSWKQWRELLWNYQKYVLVVVVFAVSIFYTVAVVPQESSKKSKSSSSQSVKRIAYDITTEKPEKNFTGILQGRSGDWYRMGFSTVANHAARIDVSLHSVFSGDVSIGALDIEASDDFQYHEILFQIPPGTFSDIKFVLHSEDTRESWSYTGVKVSEFALSRLNIRSKAEADRLTPTLAGNIEHDTKILAPSKEVSNSGGIFESRFFAEADFIENIRLNAKEQLKNNGYVLELREIVKGDAKNTDVSIKKVILEPGELESSKDEWGNQLIAFPARLEKGKEYRVLLKGTGDASYNIVFLPLEGLNSALSDGKSIAAIVFGRYAYVKGGAMLSGAKVEDFGGEILYSYSLSGEENDFFDLFDTDGSVKFDAKRKTVVGEQKQRTSFTYRFFTVYPFEKFMLAARQAGNSEKEIKLEYSFDNVFWREVPYVQAGNEPQVFSFAISGTGNQDTMYIRASYNSEDKKTGTFSLDQLSVRAELIRK